MRFLKIWEIKYKKYNTEYLLRNWPWNLTWGRISQFNLHFPHCILNEVGPVSSTKNGGNFEREKKIQCFRFRMSLHRQVTALMSTWVDRLSVYELLTLRWTTRKSSNSREKEGKRDRGGLPPSGRDPHEGCGTKVLNILLFPKWPVQHNNTPHLDLMDAFDACAVEFMRVCGIFIYLHSLITGEMPYKVHTCAYVVCWYVVWRRSVRVQVYMCVCVYWREPKQLGASSLPFP